MSGIPATSVAASIHDLPPLEVGGIIARIGLHIQDHVAAGFCIDMLVDASLIQVWCESQDDITLIWNHSPESVEFVQVKSNELDQLWSIAEICKKEKSSNGDGWGTSIVERSLAYDRCKEPCRFRLVTARPMNSDLEPLKHPIACPLRKEAEDKLKEIKQQLGTRVGTFSSGNGHNTDFWADNTVWQVIHSMKSIEDENLLKLEKAVEAAGEYLAQDQVAEQAKNLDFDQASDELTDGINDYLNKIKATNPRSWTISAQVKFELREKGFRVKVGSENWKSKLGGTLTLYFVIAYQYSLLQLSKTSARNFPGLLLLDFPAQLEDGTSVADKENFVLEPFLKLCEQLGENHGQVIAMGSAFKDLAVATRRELTTVYGNE